MSDRAFFEVIAKEKDKEALDEILGTAEYMEDYPEEGMVTLISHDAAGGGCEVVQEAAKKGFTFYGSSAPCVGVFSAYQFCAIDSKLYDVLACEGIGSVVPATSEGVSPEELENAASYFQALERVKAAMSPKMKYFDNYPKDVHGSPYCTSCAVTITIDNVHETSADNWLRDYCDLCARGEIAKGMES